MKKFLGILAAGLVAFSMVSCEGGNNEPEPKVDLTVDIQCEVIQGENAPIVKITLTPSDDNIEYYWNNDPVWYMEQNNYKTLYQYVSSQLTYGKTISNNYDHLKEWNYNLRAGQFETTETHFDYGEEYIVYACAVDTNLNIISKISSIRFTTPERK